jgi:hypothetical protein
MLHTVELKGQRTCKEQLVIYLASGDFYEAHLHAFTLRFLHMAYVYVRRGCKHKWAMEINVM